MIRRRPLRPFLHRRSSGREMPGKGRALGHRLRRRRRRHRRREIAGNYWPSSTTTTALTSYSTSPSRGKGREDDRGTHSPKERRRKRIWRQVFDRRRPRDWDDDWWPRKCRREGRRHERHPTGRSRGEETAQRRRWRRRVTVLLLAARRAEDDRSYLGAFFTLSRETLERKRETRELSPAMLSYALSGGVGGIPHDRAPDRARLYMDVSL